jgi:ATP-dependent DNA ligase
MLSMLHAFSLPTKSDKVPTGSDWIHEIEYDGYHFREQDRVRLISRAVMTGPSAFR